MKISLLGEAHYFHHKEGLIECFQMKGIICLLHSSNAARCPTALLINTCSLIIWRRFAKVHMKNMPPCSSVAMIGCTQCDRKKTTDFLQQNEEGLLAQRPWRERFSIDGYLVRPISILEESSTESAKKGSRRKKYIIRGQMDTEIVGKYVRNVCSKPDIWLILS